MKEEIESLIREKRPNATAGTIKTYSSVLRSLAKKLDADSINVFDEKKRILDAIDDMKSNQTKKTLLSALFIITGDEEYREKMMHFSAEVNKAYKEQRTNPERLKNLPSLDAVKAKYAEYKAKLGKNATKSDYVDFFIVAATSTAVMPIRRNLDWIAMKLRNFDRNTDNFIEKGNFVFNRFKTAKHKTEEERKMDIPAELRPILKRWTKLNAENDYLIFNPATNKPFSSSQLTKRINKIYGDKVGVDAIRALFLSDVYKGLPPVAELEKLADNMGNSVNSALQYYVKRD